MSGRGHYESLWKNLLEVTLATPEPSTSSCVAESTTPSKQSESRPSGRGKFTELPNNLDADKVCAPRGRASLSNLLHYQDIIFPKPDDDLRHSISSHGSNDNATTTDTKACNRYCYGGLKNFITNEKPIEPIQKHGTWGTSVSLATNYVRINCNPDKCVTMYDVKFTPNVDSIGLRKKYLNQHSDALDVARIFDGDIMYLPNVLPNDVTNLVSQGVDGGLVQISVSYKKKMTMKDSVQLFNILFHKVMKTLNYVRYNNRMFDPNEPHNIPQHKLEIWPGFVIAINEYDGGLMVCCDVSHRVLSTKTVLQAMEEIYYQNPRRHQENVKKALLGAVVITHYNNRTYRIDDVCFDKNAMDTFKYKDMEISYVDYYRQHYDIEICDPKQPLLVSIKKQRKGCSADFVEMTFCLLPEICHLTGLRDDMKSNFTLMREVATVTRISPNQRLLAMEKFIKNVNSNEEARSILNGWGLKLNSSVEYITGRQLGNEDIYFSTKHFICDNSTNFTKYVHNELLEVVHLQNWLLIYCQRDQGVAKTFTELMQRNAAGFGIDIKSPKHIVLDNGNIESYVLALRKNIRNGVQVVVCICPESRDDRYSAIKKICCAEIPIPSQVINAKTLKNDKSNRSIVQKIALQINCKLGGTLWKVKVPFKNVMICGIDTYHDNEWKDRSVSAFVASCDASYTQWYSKSIIQNQKEELANGLCHAFSRALVAYKETNGVLPSNVIIYRDGVSFGCFDMCLNYEIPQMVGACKNDFPDYNLKVTFIIVQKRINTRYFMTNIDGGVDNPTPGTVVDNKITRMHLYDFFLTSQSVRQGTVSPIHYIVLKDDMNYSPDIIQRLSYKMCFMYYNWSGAISVPACCQYAHKLAYLVGRHIHRLPSEELSNKLFYL